MFQKAHLAQNQTETQGPVVDDSFLTKFKEILKKRTGKIRPLDSLEQTGKSEFAGGAAFEAPNLTKETTEILPDTAPQEKIEIAAPHPFKELNDCPNLGAIAPAATSQVRVHNHPVRNFIDYTSQEAKNFLPSIEKPAAKIPKKEGRLSAMSVMIEHREISPGTVVINSASLKGEGGAFKTVAPNSTSLRSSAFSESR